VGAQAAEKLETVAQARARVARGGEKPAHYTPTPPIGAVLDAETEKAVKSLYGQSGADALMAKRESESDAGVA
jgi:hypothetical protein